MKRVLFVSTQFLTEKTDHGGIGNYIHKMSKALLDSGHQAEVLVTSPESNATLIYEGITVHRVYVNNFLNRVFKKFRGWPLMRTISPVADQLYGAWLVQKRFKKLNNQDPYDIVQVPNYQAPGLFISANRSCKLYNRISSNRILYDTSENGSVNLTGRIENRLDLIQACKSDVVYAPSRFLAVYLRKNYNLDVGVLHPPAELGVAGFEGVSKKMPSKYFIHYGYLSRRKGTDIVAEALKKALVEEPGIQMVFVGKMNRKLRYLKCDPFRGDIKKNVRFIDFLEKEKNYSLVAGAHAAVLPSRVDNFPNTVLESLSLGTPVIGTYGSSIDEIVAPGVNGALVKNGSVEELSAALIDTWNGKISFSKQKIKDSLKMFDAEKSVRDFIAISDS